MSNSLGKLFTVTSFGESHGELVGVIIDGCPAGLAITEADIQQQLDKRKPGGSLASTTRKEEDKVDILCGVMDGRTTGAPIGLAIWNKDVDSSEYEKNRFILRPGQADYTSYIKYGGFSDFRGGGRFSGRTTASYVMAGAIAMKLLGLIGAEIIAHTVEIGGIAARDMDFDSIRKNASHNPLRCADTEAARKMTVAIEEAGRQGDSLGGIIEGIALNIPAGLGEPVSDALDARLAEALFSIPSVKGVEIGAGFEAARKKGSQNNDPFTIENGKVVTTSNNSGGILGGISNGMPLVVRVAIKPTASISISQPTVNIKEMKNTRLEVGGRHDVCIVPRAVTVVEAMIALTLCDFALIAGLISRVIK